jgi:tetratricopeptide (TPR) repeat protein
MARGKMGVSPSGLPMTSFRLLILAALLALASPAAFAVTCSESCQRLIHDGQALDGQGKYNEALEKYRAAQKADPQASLPISMEAMLVQRLSTQVVSEKTAQWRDAARGLAMRALALTPDDPIARETLRFLDDEGASPLHVANREAAALMAEGESLFAQHRYPEALEKYQASMKADPQYSGAWIGAADCYFMQKDWAQAETLFRRAAEIEPRNSVAWRYLADTLFNQGKFDAIEPVLLSAIEADPSQHPNWIKLASIRAQQSMPLKALALKRGVRVVAKGDGSYAVNIDEPADKKADTPDFAVRLMLGAGEANMRKTNKTATPYQIELEAWRGALTVADELKASSGKELSDPALRQIQALARDGQLEPAILILMFRQSYRPALDAWLAAHPRGVKEFIDRYGLRP